jgi:hypothetical protein
MFEICLSKFRTEPASPDAYSPLLDSASDENSSESSVVSWLSDEEDFAIEVNQSTEESNDNYDPRESIFEPRGNRINSF